MNNLQKHVESLAKELNCKLIQKPNMPGMMYVEFGYVEGPTIICQRDYFIMLHELGHVFHKHTQGRPPKEKEKFYFDNGVLKSEAQAWEYALDKSLEDPAQITKEFIWNFCLGSYYKSSIQKNGTPHRLPNGNRYYVEFVYDKPDDYFWKIVDRIKTPL